MVSSKNETVVLRMIYKKNTLNVPTTPAACGGTGSSVKRSENWCHPIPSIGLGRQTTTTTTILCSVYLKSSSSATAIFAFVGSNWSSICLRGLRKRTATSPTIFTDAITMNKQSKEYSSASRWGKWIDLS